MTMRRVRIGVTVAVLAASLTACGSAADPTRDRESAAARTGATATTNPLDLAQARLGALRSPRTAEDRWPAYTTDNRPGDALIVDRAAGRRLFPAGSPPYGLWLVPARPDDGSSAAAAPMSDLCLRVIPLTGPDRGGGGSFCMPGDAVRRDGTLLAVVRPADESRPAVVAGTVPDGVRSVQLVDTRSGEAQRRTVQDNAFLFEARRSAGLELRYRGPDGRPVKRPIGP